MRWDVGGDETECVLGEPWAKADTHEADVRRPTSKRYARAETSGSSVQRQGLSRGPAWRPELRHALSCRRWRAGAAGGQGREPDRSRNAWSPNGMRTRSAKKKKKISAHANLPTCTLASRLHSSLDRAASSRANFLQHAATASLGQRLARVRDTHTSPILDGT